MGIEVSYNRIGKGVAGLLGNQQILKLWKVWVYSLNACCEVVERREANLVPIICTKMRKNIEFHMLRLTKIFKVKN